MDGIYGVEWVGLMGCGQDGVKRLGWDGWDLWDEMGMGRVG